MVHSLLLTAAAILTVSLAIPGAGPQATTIDEGSFTITRDGAPAGREDFSIRGTSGIGGMVHRAQATVTLDGQRLSPALSTDQSGAPVTYQIEVRADGQTERLSGQVSRGRLSIRRQGSGGTSAKEYVVAEGAIILDDDVYHQYYFVAPRAPGPTNIPVLGPRRGTQTVMRLSSQGAESVVVGGKSLDATHLVLSDPGGNDRDLWVDAKGRVLKVAIPGRSIVALRDDPPR